MKTKNKSFSNLALVIHRQVAGIFHYNESNKLHKFINTINKSEQTENTSEDNTKIRRQTHAQNIFIHNYLQCLTGKCQLNQSTC